MAKASDNDEYEITSINVTPLVDIMLVLLIIFMVTTTYIVKEIIKVDLPRASTASETTARTLQIVVAKDGQTFLDGVALTDEALAAKIRAAPEKKEDLQALISADKQAFHGAVVNVLDILKTQGITKFAIQIEKGPKR